MVLLLLLTLILSASCILQDGFKVHTRLSVRCRSSRYPISVDCSWTLSPAPSATTPTKYIATYRVGHNDSAETKTCLQQTTISPRCTMNETVLLSKEPHVLNVTAINLWGVTTTLFPFVLEDIIKPDPPLILFVMPVSGNLLHVRWFPPWTWVLPYEYSLKYRLRYRRCRSKHIRQVGPTEKTSLKIKIMHPKGKYCIQVNAQHHLGYGMPSEWSHTTVFTIAPDS